MCICVKAVTQGTSPQPCSLSQFELCPVSMSGCDVPLQPPPPLPPPPPPPPPQHPAAGGHFGVQAPSYLPPPRRQPAVAASCNAGMPTPLPPPPPRPAPSNPQLNFLSAEFDAMLALNTPGLQPPNPRWATPFLKPVHFYLKANPSLKSDCLQSLPCCTHGSI